MESAHQPCGTYMQAYWSCVPCFSAYFTLIALSFCSGAMIFVVREEVIPENSNKIKFTDIATMGFYRRNYEL